MPGGNLLSPNSEVGWGAHAPRRAVFRALAENLERTKKSRALWQRPRAKRLDARRVPPHPRAGCFPTSESQFEQARCGCPHASIGTGPFAAGGQGSLACRGPAGGGGWRTLPSGVSSDSSRLRRISLARSMTRPWARRPAAPPGCRSSCPCRLRRSCAGRRSGRAIRARRR